MGSAQKQRIRYLANERLNACPLKRMTKALTCLISSLRKLTSCSTVPLSLSTSSPKPGSNLIVASWLPLMISCLACQSLSQVFRHHRATWFINWPDLRGWMLSNQPATAQVSWVTPWVPSPATKHWSPSKSFSSLKLCSRPRRTFPRLDLPEPVMRKVNRMLEYEAQMCWGFPFCL